MKCLALCMCALFASACSAASETGVSSGFEVDSESSTESSNDPLLLFSNQYRLTQASSTKRNTDDTITVTLQLSTFWTGSLKSARTTVEVYHLPDEESARSSYLSPTGTLTLPTTARVSSIPLAYNVLEPDRFTVVTLTLPGRGHLISVVGRASLTSDSTPTNNIRTLTRLSTRTGGDF